jgi:hypothetical protein
MGRKRYSEEEIIRILKQSEIFSRDSIYRES